MTAQANQALVVNVMEAANSDDDFRERLFVAPTETMRAAGMLVPEGSEEEFDTFFREQMSSLLPGADSDEMELGLEAMPSFGCSACTVAAWSVAALIVAAGAAGVATLTATSGPVLALASFAGVSSVVALAFVKSLATSIAAGTAAVAKAICKWTDACP